MEWARGPIIGWGSTATVSLATSVSSGELFALKSAELSRSHLLQREQCILSNLTSPYIVKYIGSSVSHDHNNTPMYNLCMEYAAAGTLTDLIRRRGGRLGEAEIASAARRILKGLEYLHANGLAHCDIKARNVLVVDEEEGPKIGDFGCAKFVGGGGGGVVSGTPAFMAPEVARGEEQGFAADVWAVGCTVIEMASGRNPWSELGSDNPVSALYRIGFSDDSPHVPSWLSNEAKDFAAKCLIKCPRERWTAKELLGHPFLDESEATESKEDVSSTTTRSPSCVLDQGFWDSMDSPRNQTRTIDEEVSCSRTIPDDDDDERIKSLITGFCTEWNSAEEEGWMTVRSNVVECEEQENQQDIVGNEAPVVGVEDASSSSYWLWETTSILGFNEEVGSWDSDETELELASIGNPNAIISVGIISTRFASVVGNSDNYYSLVLNSWLLLACICQLHLNLHILISSLFFQFPAKPSSSLYMYRTGQVLDSK